MEIRRAGFATCRKLMRLLIDMNLPPGLSPVLRAEGFEAEHWSTLGAVNATDQSIMAYASEHHLTVVTHDLDFGAILAGSRQTWQPALSSS